MLIPLGTDRPLRRPSIITPGLILLCTALYALQMLTRSPDGVSPLVPRFWVIGGEGFGAYRSLTYAFLHGDILHLAGNMLFLWVFGRPVEDRFGRIGFLLFYLGGAAAGGLVHAWFEAGPAIGASGAVSAVTGAFLVLFPRTRIRVLWFFIMISLMMAPAWFFIGLQIAWNILAETTGGAGKIAVKAHLGGYAYGFAVASTLLVTGVLSREPCDLFSISKHAKRRRDFKAAARLHDPKVRLKPKSNPALAERSEAVARDRAAVSTALSHDAIDEAAAAYRVLVERHAGPGGGGSRENVTLARNSQYRLGTHLATVGDGPLAIRAFDDFLGAYPNDPEAGQIKVLLARLCRSIGADGRARRLLIEAAETARDESVRTLARSELGELGPDEKSVTQNNAGSPARERS